MASVTAPVSAENGNAAGGPHGHERPQGAKARRAPGVGGIGTGVEASNADVLVLSCDRLGREERETMETLRGEAPDTPSWSWSTGPGRSARDALASGAERARDGD
jgi:hypothetical protein